MLGVSAVGNVPLSHSIPEAPSTMRAFFFGGFGDLGRNLTRQVRYFTFELI
jgi:hypothetical protein